MNALKNFITPLLLISLFFAACNKHYIPQQDIAPKLIKFGDDYNNNQFEYDAATSRINKLTIVIDSVPTVYNVTYQNGVPSQVQSSLITDKFIYADNHIIRSELYYNNSPDLQSKIVYSYSGDVLNEQVFYEKNAPSAPLLPQLKYKYETLPNGDISKIDIFLWDNTAGAYNFVGSNHYEYDGHTNPVYVSRDFNLFYAFPATPHNVQTVTSFDASGAQISVTTYNYTYNGAGYPTQAKRTYTPTGRPSSVTTLNYVYQ